MIAASQSFHEKKTTENLTTDKPPPVARQTSGGRSKQTPKKKPVSSDVDDGASSDDDNESSSDEDAAESERMTAVFAMKNVKRIVEELKTAVAPMYLALAEAEDEIKKLSRTSGSRVVSKYDTLATKLQHKYVSCVKSLASVRRKGKFSPVKPSAKTLVSVDEDDGIDATSKDGSKRRLSGGGKKAAAAEDDETRTPKKSAGGVNLKSTRSSRADKDVQRDLHREVLVDRESLDDDSEDSDANDDDDDDDSDDSEEEEPSEVSEEDNSSNDSYDPKGDRDSVKKEIKTERRVSRNKQITTKGIN